MQAINAGRRAASLQAYQHGNPRGPARKAIVLKCNHVVTKIMHTKERKPCEEEEDDDDDGFWRSARQVPRQVLYDAPSHSCTPGCHCYDVGWLGWPWAARMALWVRMAAWLRLEGSCAGRPKHRTLRPVPLSPLTPCVWSA